MNDNLITTGLYACSVLAAVGVYGLGSSLAHKAFPEYFERREMRKFQRAALAGKPVTSEGQFALPIEYERG
jgi:hypothetical protein